MSSHYVECKVPYLLGQWFSTFLIMCPFNIVPRGLVIQKHKIIFVTTV